MGFVSLGLSLRLGLTLILFYKSSSVLTKVGSGKKKKLTDDYKVKRRAHHVLSCSDGTYCAAALVFRLLLFSS